MPERPAPHPVKPPVVGPGAPPARTVLRQRLSRPSKVTIYDAAAKTLGPLLAAFLPTQGLHVHAKGERPIGWLGRDRLRKKSAKQARRRNRGR
jgi:hypothetical protein